MVFKKVWKKYTLFFEGFTYKVAVQYQVSRSMTKGQVKVKIQNQVSRSKMAKDLDP